jgi:hypothetical protein
MERVTGIIRTAAHAMGVAYEQIRTSASERHGVLNGCDSGCGGPTSKPVPGDAGSSTCCGLTARWDLMVRTPIKHLLLLQFYVIALHSNLH